MNTDTTNYNKIQEIEKVTDGMRGSAVGYIEGLIKNTRAKRRNLNFDGVDDKANQNPGSRINKATVKNVTGCNIFYQK